MARAHGFAAGRPRAGSAAAAGALAGLAIGIAGVPTAGADPVEVGVIASVDGQDRYEGFMSPFGVLYRDGGIGILVAGDMFGVTSRATAPPPGVPDALLDDSDGSEPSDTAGIVPTSDTGWFFGIVDLTNGMIQSPQWAEWTFDVSGLTGLRATGLFAAMGIFEQGSDGFVISWSLDGGAYEPLFTGQTDVAGTQTYTMASGAVVELERPMRLNGVALDNRFRPFSAEIPGTGTTLKIHLIAWADGNPEAMAFRDLRILAEASGGGCVADMNGDGAADVGDLLAFLGAFRAQAPSADVDGDGSATVSDLLAFLGAFRAGCPAGA